MHTPLSNHALFLYTGTNFCAMPGEPSSTTPLSNDSHPKIVMSTYQSAVHTLWRITVGRPIIRVRYPASNANDFPVAALRKSSLSRFFKKRLVVPTITKSHPQN